MDFVEVVFLVIDDDLTIRAWYRNEKDGDVLSGDVPTPVLLANAGHRVKLRKQKIKI